MNAMTNPFTPGAGFMPPELAGRQEAIERGKLVACRTRLSKAERGMMLIGPRGVGKTALLKHLAELARREGCIPVVCEVREAGQEIEELAVKLKEALSALDVTSKFKANVREAFITLAKFVRRFSLNVGTIGIEIESTVPVADKAHLEYDLSEVLLASARAAKISGTAIGLYLDELQNMQSETLAGIIVALHHAAQDLLPLYLIGSGLPTIRAIVGKSKTYAERMFTYEEIGPLDAPSSDAAIRKPLNDANVDIEKSALSAIYEASHGYPFFLQELGYCLWRETEQSPITREDVIKNLPSVSRNLDRDFFDVRFDRISPGERKFLRAMADASDSDEKEINAIASVLHRTPNALAMTRRSLIRKGMIYAPRQGILSYTVPLFDDYIKRTQPS